MHNIHCCKITSVVSDSVRPHRRPPTRLPRPWDSPGKNTGVGCHFLLQCMKVKSESEVAQSCPTLSDPMHCSPPGSSVHGIFQARVLEWGAIAFSVLKADWCKTKKHFIFRLLLQHTILHYLLIHAWLISGSSPFTIWIMQRYFPLALLWMCGYLMPTSGARKCYL